MGLQSESKQIGRFKYRVTQLPFGQGRKMLVRLTRTLGPVLGKALADTGVVGAKAVRGGKLSLPALGAAIEEFSSRLSEEDLSYACEMFGNSTSVELSDGKKPTLTPSYQEMHFAGHYAEMFEWLVFAAEVNYRDFLSKLGAPLGAQGESADIAVEEVNTAA